MATHTQGSYKAHRTDEFGDRWVFEYNSKDARGTVTGSDMNWESYPVLRGFALDLLTSDEDLVWLWRSWREAVERHGDPGIYGDGRTTTEGPAEDFCPLCLEYRMEFEGHHCVWKMDGGSDHEKNLLPLCKSCHALTSHGDGEDSNRRDRAAYYHQAARFGAAFFYNATLKVSSKERKTFQSLWPNRIKGQPRADRLEQGCMLRNWHEPRYVYWRDTALEKLPRFDLLTRELYYEEDLDRFEFERDRVEYMRKWEANRRSA